MQHFGIYSGTFDPVHAGHLAFADMAHDAAGLNKVIFMPEPQPRGKDNVTPVAIRISQLAQIINPSKYDTYQAKHSRFQVTETLAELRNQYPGVRLSFLVGSDVAMTLPSWPDINELTRQHQIIVGMRSTDKRTDIETVLQRLGARYIILTTPHADMSSRQIRGLSQHGLDIVADS